MGIERLRIFISSPGDVAEERVIANNVVRRLSDECAHRLWIEPVFWEHEPLLATDTFQNQIPRPSDCQIVVCVLWSRLGTRLPADITRPDGSRYASGTEYEFEDAVDGRMRNGYPDLLVYRKTADPVVSLNDTKALMERVSQKDGIDSFIRRWFFDASDGTLKAAFHQFEKSSQFEQILMEHLRKLIARHCEKMPADSIGAPPAKPYWTAGSPFRGLGVFDFEHAAIFFGRTQAIGDVLNALRQNAAAGRAFVLVVGVSGGGKSSLARAGVVPVLTQPGVIEGVGLWRRAMLRPSDGRGDLLRCLASSLLAPEALPELGADGTTPEQLANLLRKSPAAAYSLIKGGLSQAAAEMAKKQNLSQQPEARLVLVADQFEELFTLTRVTATERHAFIAALSALARSGKVWVIATLRGDFYHRCFELPQLVGLQEASGQYALPLPTPAEIAQIIREPARAAGLRFEEDPHSRIPLDEVLREAASGSPESLPLLEFALEELYQRKTPEGVLTYDAYRELGGVEGALAKRAEAVFESLEREVQATLPGVMQGLVSVGDGEAIARQEAIIDVIAQTSHAKSFVEAFVQARLFTADRTEAGQAVVRVTHEALLRNWPRAKQWLEQDKELLLVRGRLSAAADRWDREARRPDLLLGEGKPLEEAKPLLANPPPGFSEKENAFVRASVAMADRRRRRKNFIATVVLLLAVAGTLASYAAYRGERRRREQENQLRLIAQQTAASREVLNELHVTLSLAQDIQASALKFVLTRDDRFRRPVDEGYSEMSSRFERLDAMTSDDPEQRARVDSLNSLCTGLYRESSEFLLDATTGQDNGGGASRFIQDRLQSSQPGYDKLDDIRKVVAEIESAENLKIKRLAQPAKGNPLKPEQETPTTDAVSP